MKTALFTNFTNQEFTGWWDGKSKKFAPGQSLYMQDFLARHFAKHLANRELLRKDANGNLVYPEGEKMTSPKKPEDAPLFMDLFNKAYTPDEADELGEKGEDIDSMISVANKNREAKAQKAAPQEPNGPQIVLAPDDGEDEEDFGGKPVETAAPSTT